MRKGITLTVAACVAALALSACGSTQTPGTGDPSDGEGDVELLGGAEVVAALDELYQAAIEAGQTTVTVYGPGEADKQAIYDEIFSQRFPEITVTGVYVLGPDYAAKMEAEFASGQHVADLVQAGDTSIAPNLAADYIEPFTPMNVDGVDAEAFSDDDGTVWAASAATFGIMYNTNLLSADEAPQGWEDLLDPSLAGKMTSDDLTRNGAGFGTLSHLMWDGGVGDDFAAEFAAQEITFQSSTPVAGSAVATGQFAVEPFYTMSYFLADSAKGAPVEFVFPTEGGVHLSPHYLGVVKGASNPDAARLLMTWLFTPEAQQAMAGLGYSPLVAGQAGPNGFPPVDELDLLKPWDLADLQSHSSENLALVKEAFGG